MTASVTNSNFPIYEATQKVYADLKSAATAIQKERDTAFSNQPLWKRITYYACVTLALGGAVVTVASLPLALVTWSASYLLVGVVASVACIIGGLSRERFNTITVEEEQFIKRFSEPEAKRSLDVFLSYVNPFVQETDKVLKEEYDRLKSVVKFFEGKIERNELVKKMSTVVVTGFMVEALQNCVAKKQAFSEKKAEAVEKLWNLSSFDANMRAQIGFMAEELKKAPNARLPAIQNYLTTLQGQRKVQCDLKNMDNLMQAIDAARSSPAPAPIGGIPVAAN